MISRLAPSLRSIGFKATRQTQTKAFAFKGCRETLTRGFATAASATAKPAPSPKATSKDLNFAWTESADVYFRPFGPSFVLIPIPPTNEKFKVLLTDQMSFEHLAQLIIYKVPQSDITVTDLDSGK